MYKGKLWSLAEDHINFTIGRQSFNLKQLDNAAAAFKHLLTADSKQSPPQQNAFLREYLYVYKVQSSYSCLTRYLIHDTHKLFTKSQNWHKRPATMLCELGLALNNASLFIRYLCCVFQQLSNSPSGGELPQLPLPLTDGNAIKVLTTKYRDCMEDSTIAGKHNTFYSTKSTNSISGHFQLAYIPVGCIFYTLLLLLGITQASSVSFHSKESDNPTWQKLEEMVVVSNEGSIPINFKPCIQCSTNRTNNYANPLAVLEGQSLDSF